MSKKQNVSHDIQWAPDENDVQNATKDVAWEFAAMLAAALQMAKGPLGPTNHQTQEVFLLHVRNLGEFFRKGAVSFKEQLSICPTKTRSMIRRKQDNIFAVDFCSAIHWTFNDFTPERKLTSAINKTLSHMTYSRFSQEFPFSANLHAHGTVSLLRRTWDGFLKSLRPKFQPDLMHWLHEHTKQSDLWGLRPLGNFSAEFEYLVSANKWQLNQTPNGPVEAFPYPSDFPYSINPLS